MKDIQNLDQIWQKKILLFIARILLDSWNEKRELYLQMFCIWGQKVVPVLLKQLLQVSLTIKKIHNLFDNSQLEGITSQSSNKSIGCISASVGKQTPIKFTMFKCLKFLIKSQWKQFCQLALLAVSWKREPLFPGLRCRCFACSSSPQPAHKLFTWNHFKRLTESHTLRQCHNSKLFAHLNSQILIEPEFALVDLAIGSLA